MSMNSTTAPRGAGIPVLSSQQRNLRILYWVLGFYILWNPSGYHIVGMVWWLIRHALALNVESGWKWLLLAVIGIGVAIGLAFLWRRYHQAVKDTSMFQLVFQTLIVAAMVGAAAYSLILLGLAPQDHRDIALYMGGSCWQVPLGYFFGKGLNWVFEDRQTAGFQGTQEVDKHGGHHGADAHAPVDTGGHHG